MSTALWCDKGDHAFSAKDPFKQHFSQTQTVTVPTGNSYGRATYEERREVTEELDICGPCWSKANPFSPDQAPKTAINSQYGQDTLEAEIDAAQAETQMWKTRYEAEKARRDGMDNRGHNID